MYCDNPAQAELVSVAQLNKSKRAWWGLSGKVVQTQQPPTPWICHWSGTCRQPFAWMSYSVTALLQLPSIYHQAKPQQAYQLQQLCLLANVPVLKCSTM